MEAETLNLSGHTADDPRTFRQTAEQKRRRREVESIARQLDRPASEIEELYADVYAQLKARASVVDYLSVLAAKKVRAWYRH